MKKAIKDILSLWFDVERGYKTTAALPTAFVPLLWFDVERGYKTTSLSVTLWRSQLWFDVERGYKTTYSVSNLS